MLTGWKGEMIWRSLELDLELSVLDANLPDDILGNRSDLSPEDRGRVEVQNSQDNCPKKAGLLYHLAQFHDLFL